MSFKDLYCLKFHTKMSFQNLNIFEHWKGFSYMLVDEWLQIDNKFWWHYAQLFPIASTVCDIKKIIQSFEAQKPMF